MVTRRSSDAAPPATPIAPVVKRKRRASCLGEQERRERKRAIDREAQRSLREKTKTHIAELERTIRILRDQDRNGATASLLSEIEGLRAENERLRDIIDGVKSVLGSELFPRTTQCTNNGGGNEGKSPAASSAGRQSPLPRRSEPSKAHPESKPPLHLPSLPQDQTPITNPPFDFSAPVPMTSRRVDLDGMVLPDLPYNTTDPKLDLSLDLQPVSEVTHEMDLDHPDSPITAAFAPLFTEIFGPGWRCPSPIVLHIGNPPTTASPSTTTICPTWKKSNELFGQVFSYRPGTATSRSNSRLESVEAGFLFRGIRDGWSSFDEWKQSPALKILKSVDEFLFVNLPKLERLATAYKSYKLLKYYLSATKADLENVPKWLRPSPSQSGTSHPIALDFFAWPTLRSRLLATYPALITSSDLSHCYSHYLRFDWPFSFEDTFFYDDDSNAWYPSPLFERYHSDLRYWGFREQFYDRFPEIRGDVEGDWRVFGEEVR
ncbi:hypothetical protein K458DRAFT_425405 [Lentithecium fluviatile CBS 122367]|uniref:BZIP domain-containing protein n=1 Tax=Lentithecium fluviatile CBS 122367 TaxID=1168545 RepID=A0A6G1JLJ6_9PLEO|nr:hypothetical protein K458DRAFT_425405 [Lentithecium fluviatile CBS 122367]